jgi:hypothetical protein
MQRLNSDNLIQQLKMVLVFFIKKKHIQSYCDNFINKNSHVIYYLPTSTSATLTLNEYDIKLQFNEHTKK